MKPFSSVFPPYVSVGKKVKPHINSEGKTLTSFGILNQACIHEDYLTDENYSSSNYLCSWCQYNPKNRLKPIFTFITLLLSARSCNS